ncbi:MAG TPA: hypothetical protein VN797_02735 [Gemmatimonadaceae bacterium]|nr:hypothetical protein [Gemmatimonadaceae bacterium]
MSRASVWIIEERSPDKGREWQPCAESDAYMGRVYANRKLDELRRRYAEILWKFRAVRYVRAPQKKVKKR